MLLEPLKEAPEAILHQKQQSRGNGEGWGLQVMGDGEESKRGKRGRVGLRREEKGGRGRKREEGERRERDTEG